MELLSILLQLALEQVVSQLSSSLFHMRIASEELKEKKVNLTWLARVFDHSLVYSHIKLVMLKRIQQ